MFLCPVRNGVPVALFTPMMLLTVEVLDKVRYAIDCLNWTILVRIWFLSLRILTIVIIVAIVPISIVPVVITVVVAVIVRLLE